MKKKEAKIEVIQDQHKPVSTKVLAESIVRISEATRNLLASGLNERAIQVLVKDSSGVPMADTQKVLNSLRDLERMYCR